MVLFVDPLEAANIRVKVGSIGLGDIYTYNQYFYRIQINGNPVLPVAFLVSLFAIRSKRIKIAVASLLFMGTIIAGNLAFILAIIFFFGMYLIIQFFSNKKVLSVLRNFFSSKKRVIMTIGAVLLVCIAVTIILYPYLYEVFQRKMVYSLPARFDQVKYLIGNLAETPISLLFGQGFGNLINVITDYRDYRNNIYFELQTIYMLNQVGILYFLLFWVTKIIFVIRFWGNKYIYLIYLSYMLYAFTNPYMFDTTNIVVIIVLSSLSKLYFKDYKSEPKI